MSLMSKTERGKDLLQKPLTGVSDTANIHKNYQFSTGAEQTRERFMT